MVHGYEDIRTLHFEQQILGKLDERIDASNDAKRDETIHSWRYRLVSSTIINTGDLIYMLLLATMLYRGSLAPAMAIVLYNYHDRLGSSAIFALLRFSESSAQLRLACDRIRSLISSREFPKERFGKIHAGRLEGQIEFRNVSFSYHKRHDRLSSGRKILNGLSFEIKPRQTVAFVGSSGCGKSTIFRLLSKQYITTGGEILLDGINIDMLDQDSLRSSIAVINQKPYIFNASIRDNLLLARPDMTEEEMVAACKAACIHDDILRMEKGYDTIVSEDGADMSGGQKQRLAIARGFLCNASIFLMDEATSALDNTTQERVLQAVRSMSGERTILMIAHRLSTIVNADVIFFISNGKLLMQGTHEELLKNCKEYRDLYMDEQQ